MSENRAVTKISNSDRELNSSDLLKKQTTSCVAYAYSKSAVFISGNTKRKLDFINDIYIYKVVKVNW